MFIRCPAFGFIAGQEVKAAGVGNIGLEDRRSSRIVAARVTSDSDSPQNASLFDGFKNTSQLLVAILTASPCKYM